MMIDAGEVIGSLCIPVSNSASMLKRAASIKMLQQAPEFHKFSSHPLRRKVFQQIFGIWHVHDLVFLFKKLLQAIVY